MARVWGTTGDGVGQPASGGTKDTYNGDPSDARRTLSNSREVVEPFPVLPVRLLRASDRLDIFLEGPKQLLKLGLPRLLARGHNQEQPPEVVELLLDQPDLRPATAHTNVPST